MEMSEFLKSIERETITVKDDVARLLSLVTNEAKAASERHEVIRSTGDFEQKATATAERETWYEASALDMMRQAIRDIAVTIEASKRMIDESWKAWA